MNPDPTATDAGDTPSSGPMLALLARGLELWLRQQCEAIERLEIRLEGSALRLLQGRLDGVHLKARGVVYQAMEIEQVELSSDRIQVRPGPLLRSQTVVLENPFRIRGQVVFNGPGLNRSLSSPQWQFLGDGLAEQLLGLTPLGGVRIQPNSLVLFASAMGAEQPVEIALQPCAVDGTVELRSLDGSHSTRLPMDPSIHIERASLGCGLLELLGEATVLP